MKQKFVYLVLMVILALGCGREVMNLEKSGLKVKPTLSEISLDGKALLRDKKETLSVYGNANNVVTLSFNTRYKGGNYFLKFEGGDYTLASGGKTYTQEVMAPLVESESGKKSIAFTMPVSAKLTLKPVIYFSDVGSTGEPSLLDTAFNKDFRIDVLPTTGIDSNADFAVTLRGDISIVGSEVGLGLATFLDGDKNAIQVTASDRDTYTYTYTITTKVKEDQTEGGDINLWSYESLKGSLNKDNGYKSEFGFKTSLAGAGVYRMKGLYEVTIVITRSDGEKTSMTKTLRFFDDRLDFSLVSTNSNFGTLDQEILAADVDMYQENDFFKIDYVIPVQSKLKENGVKVTYKYDPTYFKLYDKDTYLEPNKALEPVTERSYTCVGLKATDKAVLEVVLTDKKGATRSRFFNLKVNSRTIDSFVTSLILKPYDNAGTREVDFSIISADASGIRVHNYSSPRFSHGLGDASVPKKKMSTKITDITVRFTKTSTSDNLGVLSYLEGTSGISINNTRFTSTTSLTANTSYQYMLSNLEDTATGSVSFTYQYCVNGDCQEAQNINYNVRAYVRAEFGVSNIRNGSRMSPWIRGKSERIISPTRALDDQGNRIPEGRNCFSNVTSYSRTSTGQLRLISANDMKFTNLTLYLGRELSVTLTRTDRENYGGERERSYCGPESIFNRLIETVARDFNITLGFRDAWGYYYE